MLVFPLKNEVENISWLCPLQRLATAPPAREPLAPGWWAWLRELLSFDNIWDSFAAVAPRVLPLSWAKSISELRWSSYLTNTEGTPAAHPCSLKRSCQNSLLLSHKIKYSFQFRVRMKSKRTLHGFTIWCDNDPCLQLYPYRGTEERHHREATSPSVKETYACQTLTFLPFTKNISSSESETEGIVPMEKPKDAKMKSMPHWQVYLSITGTPEQGLGSWPVPGKSKPAAQPNTGEIYSHAASPACLAHRGLATLGSIWFSFWHKWGKHSCGHLKLETGFSTLGLESGANLWEVTFK